MSYSPPSRADHEKRLVDHQVAAVGVEAVASVVEAVASVVEAEIRRYLDVVKFLAGDLEGFRRNPSRWLRTCRAACDGIASLVRRTAYLSCVVEGDASRYPDAIPYNVADRLFVATAVQMLGAGAFGAILGRAAAQADADAAEARELEALVDSKSRALIVGDYGSFPGEIDPRARIEAEVFQHMEDLDRIRERERRLIRALNDIPRPLAYLARPDDALAGLLAAAGDGGLALAFSCELESVG